MGPQHFTRLLDDHGSALVLYAQQWCNEPEDIVQEAFLRLMRQPSAPRNAVGWIYRVVRNEAISASRKATTRGRYEAAACMDRAPWFVPAWDVAMDAAAIADDLRCLPIAQREAIVLRLWAGRSFSEIAQIVGTSTSSAHRHYIAGITALREKWSTSCPSQGSNTD